MRTEADQNTYPKSEISNPREWVINYLLNNGHNPELASGIDHYATSFIGPLNYPLNRLHRICGPEPAMTYRSKFSQLKVNHYRKQIQEGQTLDPLIVVDFLSGKLDIADGNHRQIALNELGIDTHPAIFCLRQDPRIFNLDNIMHA